MKMDNFLCFMFLPVFLVLTLHKTRLFFRGDNQSNLSIKLCATNLRARAKRKQKIEQGYGQFNIDCNNIVLAFVEAYFIIFYALFSLSFYCMQSMSCTVLTA